MGQRDVVIARSVTNALLSEDNQCNPSVWTRIASFFRIYWLHFYRVRVDLFEELRAAWAIDDGDYHASFAFSESKPALLPMGDMGYSGSTFFTTPDSTFLIKSIPRYFEHSFFRDDLLAPYSRYMLDNSHSLLVRITDFLELRYPSIGSIIGLAPSHHIIMENIMYRKNTSNAEWQSWDLKPMSYFYPERDVAGGILTSEATKSKLADEFHEKIVLTTDQAAAYNAQLEKDTQFLSESNSVDYSLFLVRLPAADFHGSATLSEDWKTGVQSADGLYIYRAAVLDFFWAKHKVHAKAMAGLVNTYNVFDRQGPMSVTTTSPEYRTRFLKMCREMIEIQTP